MLAKDFTPLADFDPSRFDPATIDLWVNAQEPMFTKRPKLPKEVRNNMGFLKDGGIAKDKRSPFMGGGIAYAGGGRTMKRKGGKV